jgi:hypothetical protein
MVLHLCGNVSQWIISGVGGVPDARDRPKEFAERGPMAKAELLARLKQTVARAQETLSAVSATELLRPRRIQGFEETGVSALVDSVGHFCGHTHQIVYVTRLLLGDEYRFQWAPSTPEEGASA